LHPLAKVYGCLTPRSVPIWYLHEASPVHRNEGYGQAHCCRLSLEVAQTTVGCELRGTTANAQARVPACRTLKEESPVTLPSPG
jgi:hypothetical protein